MVKNNIIFREVTNSKEEICILYELLKERSFNISHSSMPEFHDHENFVKNHPYKNWYIVFLEDKPIGTFNIKFDNSIGFNLIKQETFIIKNILDFVKANFVPEPAVKSMTPNYFYCNISSKNIELRNIFEKLNFQFLQISFKL